MDIKKITAILLALTFALISLPVSAAAEAALGRLREENLLRRLDEAWAYIEPVKSEMKANGASPADTALAAYRAALNCPLVDSGSLSELGPRGFFFTVCGMACIFDMGTEDVDESAPVPSVELMPEGVKNGPAGVNVLQIMPFYLVGLAFTEELCDAEIAIGASVAEATGGSYTLILNEDVTALRVAEEIAEAGVVIVNSHGLSYNNTTYICLTTEEGLTSLDYLNGWAASISGAEEKIKAGIDGRYIKRRSPTLLQNCVIWLNMCEGMALSGCGVTADALIEAGAGCVFGYSRDTYVRWDLLFAQSFWNSMFGGATAGEAFEIMTAEVAQYIPESGAWPVLVSPEDPFPEEPDSHQTVNCGWRLFGEYEPEAPVSYSLSADVLDVQSGGVSAISFDRYPVYSQDYSLVWRIEDESVAAVAGNDCGAFVSAVSVGETELYCEVYIGGEYRSACTASVRVMPPIDEVLNVPGGTLSFFTSGEYQWKVAACGEGYLACSGNAGVNDTASSLNLNGVFAAGDVLTFRMRASSEQGADTFGFYVNGQLYGELLSGDTDWVTVSYPVAEDGSYAFQWRYSKNHIRGAYDDCGYLADVALTHGMAGDIDGDLAVTANDALLVLRYSLSLIGLDPAQIAAADFDGSGVIDANDALMLLRRALGLI